MYEKTVSTTNLKPSTWIDVSLGATNLTYMCIKRCSAKYADNNYWYGEKGFPFTVQLGATNGNVRFVNDNTSRTISIVYCTVQYTK